MTTDPGSHATASGPSSRNAKLAGLAFAPFALIPIVLGSATLIDDPNRPGSGCIDYCSFDRDIAGLGIAIGVAGALVCIGIARRHVAAMALALFVSAFATMLVVTALMLAVLTDRAHGVPMGWLLGIGALLLGIDGVLVAAMRDEMRRAVAEARTIDRRAAIEPPRPE